MKTAILWTACKRPEYAQASLESIFRAHNRPDFYAFVDRTEGGKDDEVIQLLEKYPTTRVTHRLVNHMISLNFILAWKELYDLGYDAVHLIEEDIIVSHDFFKVSVEAMNEVALFFSLVHRPELTGRETTNEFCPWGTTIRKDVFELAEPYLVGWLRARAKGHGAVELYLKSTFGEGTHFEIDGLLNTMLKYYPVSGRYPHRSYSKDIGAFGHHREQGTPPIKTLEEWAVEELTDNPGYGVQGIGFKL